MSTPTVMHVEWFSWAEEHLAAVKGLSQHDLSSSETSESVRRNNLYQEDFVKYM